MRRLAMLLPILALGCPLAEEPALVGVAVDAGPVGDGMQFETAEGYSVTLDHGVVVLGDLHFHEPKSVATRGRCGAGALWGLAAASVAQAHPGHDMSGDVKGELPGIFAVDLTAAAVPVGDALFYEGPYATASLLIEQDGVDGDAGLEDGDPAADHSLYLAGTASAGGDDLPFELVLEHGEAVLGIPFDLQVDEGAEPSLVLRVDAASILGHLDFAALDSDGDGTVTTGDDGVLNPLVFGFESTLSYGYEIN